MPGDFLSPVGPDPIVAMIDTHHHLWNYSADEYAWIRSGSPLACDYLIAALEAATAAAGVDGTVVVQPIRHGQTWSAVSSRVYHPTKPQRFSTTTPYGSTTFET
jgi:predicted TIM-barrel fold metal-dependent hydrolase